MKVSVTIIRAERTAAFEIGSVGDFPISLGFIKDFF